MNDVEKIESAHSKINRIRKTEVVVPPEILYDLEIPSTHKLMLSIIISEGGAEYQGCAISDIEFTEIMKMCRQNVHQIMQRLLKEKLILLPFKGFRGKRFLWINPKHPIFSKYDTDIPSEVLALDKRQKI